MADKGGLQLLPETRKRIEVKVPGENRMVYIGSALLVLVLLAYAGLYMYRSSLQVSISDADNQLAALEKQRNKKSEAALLTVSKQVATTSQILRNHTDWSIGLSKIEAATKSNVQFKSFSGIVSDGSFHIHAWTDNYATIAQQIAAYVADDAVKDISLDSVTSLTSGKLDFSAKITFDPAKFVKNSQ